MIDWCFQAVPWNFHFSTFLQRSKILTLILGLFLIGPWYTLIAWLFFFVVHLDFTSLSHWSLAHLDWMAFSYWSLVHLDVHVLFLLVPSTPWFARLFLTGPWYTLISYFYLGHVLYYHVFGWSGLGLTLSPLPEPGLTSTILYLGLVCLWSHLHWSKLTWAPCLGNDMSIFLAGKTLNPCLECGGSPSLTF